MATCKESVEYILNKLNRNGIFSTKAMFGEHALYVNGFVVGLICNDTLYIKDTAESTALADYCDMGNPYPGAKLHFIIEEKDYDQIEDLVEILESISEARKTKERGKNKKSVVPGSFSDRVIKLALSIPSGRITTYGAITRAAGGANRQAQSITTILGKAFQNGQKNIPFHRIVYSDGRVWMNNKYENERLKLYKKEGLEINEKGVIKDFKEKLFEFK